MKATNIEIKARSSKAKNDEIRSVLRVSGAFSHGIKHQVDTYFKTEKGLLKLRECNDKMSLIFYIREDSTGPKQSNFITYDADRSESLKAVLAA